MIAAIARRGRGDVERAEREAFMRKVPSSIRHKVLTTARTRVLINEVSDKDAARIAIEGWRRAGVVTEEIDGDHLEQWVLHELEQDRRHRRH